MILFGWGLDVAAVGAETEKLIEHRHACRGLMLLLQNLQREPETCKKLAVVTCGVHDPTRATPGSSPPNSLTSLV